MSATALPSQTEKGLGSIMWSLILYLVSLLLLAIVGVALILAPGGLANILVDPTPEDIGAFVGTIIGIVALMCGFAVIAFIAVVFFLIGLFQMYGGRAEFGPAHQARMDHALFAFLGIILVAVIGAIATSVLVPFDPIDPLATAQLAGLAGVPFAVLNAIFFGLLFLFLIRELSTPAQHRIVYAGIGVALLSVAVSSYLEVIVFPGILESEGLTFGLFTSFLGPILLTGGIEFLAILLYTLAIRETRRRVKAGEVPRVAPLYPPQVMAYPPAPIVRPAPPAQPVPAAPPGEWRYCPKCGAPASGDRFCQNCGAPLAKEGGGEEE